MITAPIPGSPEWLKIVTSSKVAAILGVSPYDSPYSMWHKMKGNVSAETQTDVMARGHFLEEGIRQWWLSKHPEYCVLRNQHYSTRDEFPWASATLDSLVYGDELDDRSNSESAILEIKTSIQSDEWGEAGTDAIPMYVLTQVYWQFAMTLDAKRAYIALLGPFLNFSEFVVERPDQTILDAMIEKCRIFYESLALDDAPDLDNSLATFQTLKALHPDIDSGTTAEIDYGLAVAYLEAVKAEKSLSEVLTGLKSQILVVAGRANYVESNGFRVARRQANRSGVSLVAIQPKEEM